MSAYTDGRDKVVPHKKGPRCQMCTLMARISVDDPESAAHIQADLDAKGVVIGTAIGSALKEMGYPIGQFTVDRHRRGDCDPR